MFNILLAFLCSVLLIFLSGYNLPKISTVYSNSEASVEFPYELKENDIIKKFNLEILSKLLTLLMIYY